MWLQRLQRKRRRKQFIAELNSGIDNMPKTSILLFLKKKTCDFFQIWKTKGLKIMDLFASLYLEGICKDKRLNADLKLKSSCIHNQWNKKAEGNEFVTKTRCLLTDELTSISRATFQKEKNQFTFKAQNSTQRDPEPNSQHVCQLSAAMMS